MLRRLLFIFGWGTILFTSIYELRQFIQLLNTGYVTTGSPDYVNSEIKNQILLILTGLFQGLGIGLLCLYAGYRIHKSGIIK